MNKRTIYFSVGLEVEGDTERTAAAVAWAIRDWLAQDKEGALDAILDCLADAPFEHFPADVAPPTNWHFGEGRIELDASPLSSWQTSIN